MKSLVKSLVLLLVGAAIGIALTLPLSLLAWFRETRQPAIALPASSLNLLSEEEKLLAGKIELDGKRSEDVQHLLEILIAVSGFSALALYVKALQDAKESEDKLKEIRQDADKEAERIRASFPRVADLEKRLQENLHAVAKVLPTIDLSGLTYENLAASSPNLEHIFSWSGS